MDIPTSALRKPSNAARLANPRDEPVPRERGGSPSDQGLEALAPFGLDPREKAFWAAGMKQMERLVDEFEALG